MDKATILGTASAFPTKTRNHPSIYVNLNGVRILLDCGEGTQRQIRSAGLSPSVDYVFITHWHGDHSLGVGGIVQSLNMMRKDTPLTIVGPAGTNSSVKHILDAYKFYKGLVIKVRTLDAKKESLVMDIKGHSIYAINVKHVIKCLGYKIKEKDSRNIRKELLDKLGVKSSPQLKSLKAGKDIVIDGKKLKASQLTYIKKGKSLVYLTDLIYDKNLYRFAKDADVLIIESTFSSELQERAKTFMHLTVKDALTIAKRANAKKIYLVHFSQRYENLDTIEKEAAALSKSMGIKAEVILPQDLSEITV